MAASENVPLIHHRQNDGQKFVLVIHGGSGSISQTSPNPEGQLFYKAALRTSLEVGYTVLREGGEAMDAAVAAVTVLEGGLPC